MDYGKWRIESSTYNGLDHDAYAAGCGKIVAKALGIQRPGQILRDAVFDVDAWCDITEATEICRQAGKNPWQREASGWYPLT